MLRLLSMLNGCWRWAHYRLLALKPCRAALLMVFAVLLFLIVASQGQDVARALAERHVGHDDEWQRFFFFSGVLAWSLYAWYWSRIMLRLEFPGVPPDEPQLRGLRTWTPRALGAVAAAGVAVALYRASLGYADGEHPEVRSLLLWSAFWCLLGAIVFFAAVWLRRPLSRAAYQRLKGVALLQRPLAAPVVSALDVRASGEEIYGALQPADLGRLTRVLLYGAIGVALLGFVLFTFALQRSAPVIGSAAILIFAATGWIAFGSALDFVGMRLRYPAFLTLLALAVLFSPWNDNHEVRTLDASQPGRRDDLRGALRAWMSRQPAGREGKHRLYVVSAEGGGIRAAYWTATVLGEIQRRNPRFAERLFSLSGVSGGSLGASVFVALLAEQRTAGASFDLKRKAQEILSEDFLAPVVASMLYPDLAQRFLPLPVARLDRALALEEAWERAWRRHVPGSDRLAEAVDRLWADKSVWTPVLFLNATWVETGKRLIASNVRIDPDDGAVDFADAEDAGRFFAPRGLRLSTAAHMSARFTYVSPAGALAKDGRVHGRVVDGGYFENSGATTTLEILKTVDALAEDDKEDPRWKDVEPVVIHISNEPVDPAGAESLEAAPGSKKIHPYRWANEILSPLWTLLNARGARGAYARETLRWHVGADNFLHFGLCQRSANPPLGWVLSESTRERLERQLTVEKCSSRQPSAEAILDNPGNLKILADQLS